MDSTTHKDILDQIWIKKGVLTEVGMRQDYLMGQYIQNEFMYKTNFLNKNYKEEQCRFESASEGPAIMSSYSVLKGLFLPEDHEKSYDLFTDLDEKFFNRKRFINNDLIKNSIYERSNKTKKKKKARFEDKFYSQSEMINLEKEIPEKLINEEVPKRIQQIAPPAKTSKLFVPEDYIQESGMKTRTLPYGTNVFSVHSFGNWSNELGIDDIKVCVGANSLIKRNYKKSNFNKILEKISKYGEIRKMFHLSPSMPLNFKTLWEIFDSYYSNKKMQNKNITTQFNVPEEVYKILRKEFMHEFAYSILYGDKEFYLAKAIVSPSFQARLINFERSIKQRNQLTF